MTGSLSLRLRLTLVILIPLLVIAALIGVWAFADAQARASERFDRSLLSTALAISRDIATTEGDLPSKETRDLLRDTSGGAVFYHVYAPDGVFVTGYATPPIPLVGARGETSNQFYYDASYLGNPVRALRFAQTMTIDGLQGQFTFTVWQNTSLRDGFVQSRTRPMFLTIAVLIGALAFIVWFGVSLGLRPLTDLEEAIERRSANDLSPIKRRIPAEVSGIVGKLNALLSDLSRTMAAKDVFVSDAAHQLRNPIAGVLSLAEATGAAKTLEDAQNRSAEVVEAARGVASLANNLLMLERARGTPKTDDFDATLSIVAAGNAFAPQARAATVAFTTDICETSAMLAGDQVLFEQAILNLLRNSALHGGPTLRRIHLSSACQDRSLIVTVADDGKGIEPSDYDRALHRFSQLNPSEGSGLGLSIAQEIVSSMGGKLKLTDGSPGLVVSLTFPLDA